MYFLIKDDRKANFNAWKYPIFYFFSFFETFRGAVTPCPPHGAAPVCGSNFEFPAAHPQQNQSWVPPPFQCPLCPHNKSKKCLTKQNKKQETKKKLKIKKIKPMICPGVYYVHACKSLLIHSTKALCGKWPWWMSIQELLFRSHLSCMTAHTEYHDLLDLIYQSI